MTGPEALPEPPLNPAAPRASWRDSVAVYLQRRVLIVLLLGFSSGLPLALSGSTLLVWMREAGVDLGTIGLFALVGTPYTLKFLWAPLVDALHVPPFTQIFGRRRGWLLFSQLLLIATILLLAIADPARSPPFVALAALLVATASATQDIVIDAFRVESLPESEQAAGMASYVAAYRIGMLVSTAGALFMVTGFETLGIARPASWTAGYLGMAALLLVGVATTLAAREPVPPEPLPIEPKQTSAHPRESERPSSAHSRESGNPEGSIEARGPRFGADERATDRIPPKPAPIPGSVERVLATALGALRDFRDHGAVAAILAFVVLFKLTDALAGVMTAPFVIDLGFSRDVYAAIIKGVGLAATLSGGFAGGFVARALPLST